MCQNHLKHVKKNGINITSMFKEHNHYRHLFFLFVFLSLVKTNKCLKMAYFSPHCSVARLTSNRLYLNEFESCFGFGISILWKQGWCLRNMRVYVCVSFTYVSI